MTHQAPIYVPSDESLLNCEADRLLVAFINRFNDLTQAYENIDTALKLSEQMGEGWKRAHTEKQNELTELIKLNELIESENKRCRELALEAERIANASVAVQRERDTLKTQLKVVQQELTKLKGSDNPAKLREQIHNVKTKNAALVKSEAQAKRDGALLRKERDQARTETQRAIDKIKALHKELAHNTGAGIFHKGQDHLIIWPQNLTMAREDGSTFSGRGLLYLHKSGRGGLMTYDPSTGTHLCAAPKQGLKPSNDTIDFAHNWLYKVNEIQTGIVHDDDLKSIDYNA
ncbi:hypothetical protein ACRN9N_20285 [Shewanella baltica]|uniref:hypothetical protein n=1 Tax=Shewanella baltica TaxID=62322 RepID=UPI003D7B0E48